MAAPPTRKQLTPEWEYVETAHVDLDRSLLVVATPTLGMVGTIAARFLIEKLHMQPVGWFDSPTLPPVALAQDGVATGAITLHVSNVKCGFDERCERLLVLQSPVTIEPQAIRSFATAISTWAKEAGVALVVGIEGHPEGDQDTGEGISVASNALAASMAKHLDAKPLTAGLVGFNAALLLRSLAHGVPAIGMFGHVHTEVGDARVAASMLDSMHGLIPKLGFSVGEFAKEAEALQAVLSAEAEALQTILSAETERRARTEQLMGEQTARGYQ